VVAPLASVIVPTLNGAHLLAECLDSLMRQSYPNLEVIVADGASTDGTQALLARAYPTARLLRLRRNAGFSGNVNAGLRAARGEVLCLLNNDAQAEPDWVAICVETLSTRPGAGSVASKVLFSDRLTINSAGDLFCRDGAARQRGAGQPDGQEWSVPGPVFGATGGAAAYRRAMLADTGLLDEGFFMYLEDVDLAFRAQLRGWDCYYQPLARVYHRGGATGGGVLESFYNGRNLIRLLAKDLPTGLVGRMLPDILRYQVRRAVDALGAWRGSAARATLRGQVSGLVGLPRHLADRQPIQRRRRISDESIYAMLSPSPSPGAA
jgi:GT2 family glycosyltransferase